MGLVQACFSYGQAREVEEALSPEKDHALCQTNHHYTGIINDRKEVLEGQDQALRQKKVIFPGDDGNNGDKTLHQQTITQEYPPEVLSPLLRCRSHVYHRHLRQEGPASAKGFPEPAISQA